jgi:hypothetical protein
MSNKELSSSNRSARALESVRRGEDPGRPSPSTARGGDSDSSGSQGGGASSRTDNHVHSRRHTKTVIVQGGQRAAGRSRGGKEESPSAPVSSQDMINALQEEKRELLNHTADLESQITLLSDQLKHSLNRKLDEKSNESEGGKRSVKRDPSTSTAKGDVSEERGVEVEGVYESLRDKSNRIALLVHQLEQERRTNKQLTSDNSVLKDRVAEMRDAIDNLRIELDSRPTVHQWTQKVSEVSELENQLHNMIVMRDDAAELSSWKKHLSTRDRILVDKRNHELRLWVLDSLPKAVMKETLQNICRECDVSEISEISVCISKLKAVVSTVPRMEKFITSVCNYVFNRSAPLHSEGDEIVRPAMEDVIPVLKRCVVITTAYCTQSKRCSSSGGGLHANR